MLTRNEELVLLTILKLDENAYLITIRDFLKEHIGRDLSFGTLYVLLRRLRKSRYVDTVDGEATAKRGGKAIQYYRIAESGIDALKRIQELNDVMWEDFNKLTINV
ncbi:PadR family transcriptional regulator [candidate division KSB1 bacterium]